MDGRFSDRLTQLVAFGYVYLYHYHRRAHHPASSLDDWRSCYIVSLSKEIKLFPI
jgi:hypothetical protein